MKPEKRAVQTLGKSASLRVCN